MDMKYKMAGIVNHNQEIFRDLNIGSNTANFTMATQMKSSNFSTGSNIGNVTMFTQQYDIISTEQATPVVKHDWCNAMPRPYEGFCSYNLFQSYFSVCKKLPDLGVWENISGRHLENATFSSPICKVKDYAGEPLLQQLTKTRVKRVLMAGDSHGIRCFKALKHLIVESGYQCNIQMQEIGHTFASNNMMIKYLSFVWALLQMRCGTPKLEVAVRVSVLLYVVHPKVRGILLRWSF